MMQETVFTFTDTDKEKIEKLTHLLPEKEFLGDFFESLEMSTSYPCEYNEKLLTAINLSKGTFSTFENSNVNEKYRRFNVWLSELYSFLLKSFSLNQNDANRLDLHYELKHGTDEQRKQWEAEYGKLKFIIEQTEHFYKDLLVTAHKELQTEQKETNAEVKLSDFKIIFDDTTATLKIGDSYSVVFPSYKNEHCVLRKMSTTVNGGVVGWEEIYEEMTGIKYINISKQKIEKSQKAVKDTVRAINDRVAKAVKTDSKLLGWETKCVKRLY